MTAVALMKHEVVHDTINPKHCYECTLCDKKYTTFKSLWQHQFHIHREQCKYKNTPLAHRPNITPYKSVTSQETFECYKCNKKFHFAHALYNHNRIMHPAEKLSTKCVNCEKDFATMGALHKHEKAAHKTMTSRNYHHCNDCDKKCATIDSLWAHRRKVHSDFPYKPEKSNRPYVVCTICGKSYRKNHLKRHIEQIHSGVTYKCRFCSKALKTASYLKVHESIHMGATSRLICDVCGFTTHHSSCLWRHKIRRHSAKRHRC